MRPLLLIVDDNAGSAGLLGRLLRDDGYDTEIETTGSAALERLARAPVPDALITDFHLAGSNGLVIGRYARSVSADIPIFVVTGDPAAVTTTRPTLTGRVELVAKPFNYAGFVRRLHAAIAASA